MFAGALGQSTKPAGVQDQAAKPAVQGQKPKPESPDLTKQPTLYVVGYAHLDTEWRWDYVTTIKDYIPKTMRLNFDWIEKYPHYIFNFSGANRYRMMKEYYPADYERVKKYVAAGRWFPAGSSMEENDVNSPSAESIIRQVLYGKAYFRREFGKTSAEYMLPDCFGFPASLPTILAHCGIKGFSTQKLSSSWQPAAMVGGPDSPEKTPAGIPFNVGVWEGPDGSFVIAALNPGGYGSQIGTDLSRSPLPPPPPDPNQPQRGARGATDWPARIQLNGQLTGAYADYMYYGTGDSGGSANESSIKLLEAIVTRSRTVLPSGGGRGQGGPPQTPPPAPGSEVMVGDGPVRVISATSDQLFLDLKPEQIAKMPKYKGDLELINHSAGSITSQAHMKRWNRKNEVLADAAEKASVAAELLGGKPYPLQRLNDAWTLVMGGQFHDIIPGTSIPKAYEYAWNDELLAMNQFAGVLTSATEAVASGMDTQAKGTAIVVYNPLNIPREDVVEATISFAGGIPRAVRVFGPDGSEVPAQLNGAADGAAKVLFVAKFPSAGYAVYDAQVADGGVASQLRVTQSSLENARYTIKLAQNGDVSSIFDKTLNKELLSAPMQLAIILDKPRQWPAWNMDFEDEQRAPRTIVSGPAQIRIVENGPARVAIEVAREAEGSKFFQTIRLSAGDAGNRVEIGHVMDWNSREGNLKAVFPLTASNLNATYNWDVGTIERPTETERQFEVASHQFVDLTDKSGSYGVTILTDCKNASDKPNDHTLRLTLVRTPGISDGGRGYPDQSTQDIGHHEFVYGLAGHAGDFRQGQTDWQALRLNQPLVAFQSPSHAGALGKSFSLMKISSSRIRALALKKAEQTSEQNRDEYIVRLVEMDGKPAQDVHISFFVPVISAREVNGAEEAVGPATVTGGELVASFKKFQPRTFAVKFGPAPNKVLAVQSQAVKLTYDLCVTTPDGKPGAGYWDNQGRSLPAEMLPNTIPYAGINFSLAPGAGYGKYNAVIPRGQNITLPAGNFNRLYILMANTSSTRADMPADVTATFLVGDKPVSLTVQDWSGYIGQWDNRVWKQVPAPPPTPEQLAQQAARQGGAAAGRGGQQGPRMIDVVDTLTPGYIKPASVAWFASHRHASDGTNEPYAYSYLYAYAIDVPAGAKTLTLPANERIRILAITATNQAAQARPAQVLTDYLEK
ncbi:MAG: alpha-mannosidase [Acidobacteriia bacterium]|nr:alpha-mannosidase [Terriglobia bacterium]